jgi:hypothetical protein
MLRNEEKSKKNHENIKDDENNNAVVSNITEIFVFLVKEYLTVTVTPLKFPLIFLSLEIYVSITKNYLVYKLKVSLASFHGNC